MTRRTRWTLILVAAGVVATVASGGAALAGGLPDSDTPISGAARGEAEAAALAYTGGGRVTETEVGDEESRYEVEVTMPDGRQIDVQLDETFTVVGSTAEQGPDDADGGR